MVSKSYIVDRGLHWIAALLLLLMLTNLSSQLHNMDWEIKGQLLHRQEAVESHVLMGVTLFLITLLRIVYPYLIKTKLPRVQPKSKNHEWFIKVTHLALYLCIGLLVVTGSLMLSKYEVPLSIMGVDIPPDKEAFYGTYPQIYKWHMLLKQSIWWLIGIHFVGIMYAKK